MTRDGPPRTRGLLLAAPSSASGKTVVTLGLLRALSDRGVAVAAAKSGPDYIDPQFLAAAARGCCVNLDAWAMSTERLRALASRSDLLLVEGAMGLFDGAPPNGRGSAGDLAAILGLPVVLVVDASRTGHSIAPLVQGFVDWRADLHVAGVILNRVGSPRHETMLRRALADARVAVLGAVPRVEALRLPSRHLGLVQAHEHATLEAHIETAAMTVEAHVDVAAIAAAARTIETGPTDGERTTGLPPLGQHIAVASDVAFAFAYPHMLDDWRRTGASFSFFSPLADEPPRCDADAIFLAGGYPELHGGRLAAAERFKTGLRDAAAAGALIYGECGGYMVLGDGMVDGDGTYHAMAGLLPLTTSFARRQRVLGYRRLTAWEGLPWAGPLAGHEYHYATTTKTGGVPALFAARDAEGAALDAMGLRVGRMMGSFAHVIDRASEG